MSNIPSYAIPDNLPAPVTTGTTIQSFTDVFGDIWVAKNGVQGGTWYRARDVLHLRVHRNAALSGVANNGVVIFDTVSDQVLGTLDPFGLFNAAAGTITMPLPGAYLVIATLTVSSTAVSQYIQAGIRANGTVMAYGSMSVSSASGQQIASQAVDEYPNRVANSVFDTISGNNASLSYIVSYNRAMMSVQWMHP